MIFDNNKMNDIQKFMRIAIDEAKLSLREGNSGFGAVIMKEGALITRAHDTDSTEGDPTAHAEMKAVRRAASLLGKNLSGCTLISTHEPCPMCSTALFWSGIEVVAYGFSIKDALLQGRSRIDISIKEIFDRGRKKINISEPILYDECSILYNQAVRNEIKMLRNADDAALEKLGKEKCLSRLHWFKNNYKPQNAKTSSILDEAYNLFISKLEIDPADAPIVERNKNNIIIQSKNFCPTLEACRILSMDTRLVCRLLTEKATTELLRQLNPQLYFERNYDKIRPLAPYCEEKIVLGN